MSKTILVKKIVSNYPIESKFVMDVFIFIQSMWVRRSAHIVQRTTFYHLKQFLLAKTTVYHT